MFLNSFNHFKEFVPSRVIHKSRYVLDADVEYELLRGLNYLSGGDAIITSATASNSLERGNALFIEGDVLDAKLLMNQSQAYLVAPKIFQEIRIENGNYRIMAKKNLKFKIDVDVKTTQKLPSGIKTFEPGLLVLSPEDYWTTVTDEQYDSSLSRTYGNFGVMMLKTPVFCKSF